MRERMQNGHRIGPLALAVGPGEGNNIANMGTVGDMGTRSTRMEVHADSM